MYTPLLKEDVWKEPRQEDNCFTGDDDGDDEEEEVLWSFDHTMEHTKLLDGDEKTYDDPEAKQEKIKYPRSVAFIIGTEFCERFSYYGMKAILTLYLHNELKYSEDDSTVIYHVWSMLCYFTPILGAIIADTFLGRFRTIFYISIIYVMGNAVLSISAVPPIFPDLGAKIGVSLTGLFLIAVGTGGIKPCVSAFGGDQFVVPQQERQLTQFFSIFYFSINAGSLISTYVTPILRDNIHCFGSDCYSLAFGVPAVLMLIALCLFLGGYSMYTMKPPEGNILLRVGTCTMHAISRKFKSKEKKNHWLDHASDKFDKELINDVKVLLKILLLYIPLPFFWALFDQQGSRWTFQATRMDGQIGEYTLKPDQMQVVNPLFILLFIPVFDTFVYPLLARCNLLKRQLPRMFVGGVLAGVAFLVSGFLELKLQTTYPVALNSGETRVSFINGLPCEVNVDVPWDEKSITLPELQDHIFKSIPINEANMTVNISLHFDKSNCGNVKDGHDLYEITLADKTAHAVLITADTSFAQVVNIEPPDDFMKSQSGLPKLRMLFNLGMVHFNSSVHLVGKFDTYDFPIEETPQGYISGTEFQEVEPDSYKVFVPNREGDPVEILNTRLHVKLGGVYNFLVQKSLDDTNNSTTMKLFEVTPSNSVHILWLLPQYIIITISEIMFSITGLEFSFTQAPSSMKSVLQAAWLLTVSFGNLIVVIIAEAKFFKSQAMEFFLFAVLMFVDMIIFAALAVTYRYVDEVKDDDTSGKRQGVDNECFSDDETKF
ncbi:solute carrier family 15 member 2 isoform X2 [Procambarus clarkii]|uniref:solute carrier family 15 member 2 isoform X2 n=1 Tax=Procambarus clarkii TaxID=6728 RepID=UPI003744AD15